MQQQKFLTNERKRREHITEACHISVNVYETRRTVLFDYLSSDEESDSSIVDLNLTYSSDTEEDINPSLLCAR